MPARVRRHLELLHLAVPLRRYAASLDPDPNASAFLVHRALSSAFADRPTPSSTDGLEASLRQHIDRSFAAA